MFEIGYGSGALLRRFLDDGARVAGVDPDQLRQAVDAEVVRRGELHQGALEDLDTTGIAPVDLVYGVHVIEHVRDPSTVVRAAAGLLRRGGRLELLTPAGDGDGLRLWGADWWMLEDPTHIRFHSARSLALAAERAGLHDVRVRRLVLDSLTVDPASAARRIVSRPSPEGILARPAVRAAGIALSPLVVAARLVRPRCRATLHLTARRAW